MNDMPNNYLYTWFISIFNLKWLWSWLCSFISSFMTRFKGIAHTKMNNLLFIHRSTVKLGHNSLSLCGKEQHCHIFGFPSCSMQETNMVLEWHESDQKMTGFSFLGELSL